MFKEVNNEEELEKRLGDVWFDGRKPKINRARFERVEKLQIMSNPVEKRCVGTSANVEFQTVGKLFSMMEVMVCESVLEDLENSYVNKRLWESNFKDIIKWSRERVARRRRVWLQVFGIPLHA